MGRKKKEIKVGSYTSEQARNDKKKALEEVAASTIRSSKDVAEEAVERLTHYQRMTAGCFHQPNANVGKEELPETAHGIKTKRGNTHKMRNASLLRPDRDE